jgi:CheY-like chemotaxis protein
MGERATAGEMRRLVSREVTRLLESSRDEQAQSRPAVTLFHWDARAQRATAASYDPAAAATILAARYAAALASAAPHDRAARHLALVATLAADKHRRGLDKPAVPRAGTTAAELDEALDYALANGHVEAATAAAELLGAAGNELLLMPSDARPRALVRATRHPDRRLRLAAATSIASFKPQARFAGSSHVVEALAFAAGTSGHRRALVGHPRSLPAQQIAGLLAGIGYDADAATTGREFFKMAAASPDYELAVLDAAIGKPGLRDVLEQLRKDPRTAALPLLIVAPVEELERYEWIAQVATPAVAVPLPTTVDAAQSQAAQALRLAGRGMTSHIERQRQASTAIEALAVLAEAENLRFDVDLAAPALRRALLVPHLAGRAAVALGRTPLLDSQANLAELASRSDRPLADRRAAAAAFAAHRERHGLLLSRDEIARQYERYNASAEQSRDVQQVLGSLLDAIEGR